MMVRISLHGRQAPLIIGVYTQSMPLSIPAVQAALKEEGLDGWLLYDFHGSNPIARRLAGIDNGTKTTRRWYYVIPAAGEPRKLVHAIEPHNLDHVPGGKTIYSQRDTLASGLSGVLGGLKRIAMEYSPGNNIPYISRVDAGTVEAVRQLGDRRRLLRAISSSGSKRSGRTKRCRPIAPRASGSTGSRIGRSRSSATARRAGRALTELDVQRAMIGWFEDEGLIADSPPVVAAQENAGDPHYGPTEQKHRGIGDGEVAAARSLGQAAAAGRGLCRHHLGRVYRPGGPGPIRRGVQRRARRPRRGGRAGARAPSPNGRELRGFEVDRACRAVRRTGGLRRAVRPPHRAQPGHRGPRQRRAHGRLRDPRRAPADSRHRLYDRARRLFERVRRADRDQHVSSANAKPRSPGRCRRNSFSSEREAGSRKRVITRSSSCPLERRRPFISCSSRWPAWPSGW